MRKNHLTQAMLFAWLGSTALPLLADEMEMDVILVHGHKMESGITINPSPMQTLSPDLSDILIQRPGVDINQNGPVTSLLQHRGLFGQRVGIDIDGAPVIGAGPNAMDSPLSHNINGPGTKLQLYPGIAPVSAGAEILGASLTLISSHEGLFTAQPGWSGSLLGTVYTEGDIGQGNAHLGYQDVDKYGLVTLLHQRADSQEDGNGDLIPNYQYRRSGGKVRAGYRSGDHQWHASYQQMNTDDAGTPALAMDINYIDAEWYRLSYQTRFGEDDGIQVKFYGNNNDHGMDNVTLRSRMDPMARLNTVDAGATGLEISGYHIIDMGQIDWGVEFAEEDHNSVITNPVLDNLTIVNFNNAERKRWSAFGELATMMGHWQIQGGIRYTDVNSDADEVAHSMAMMMPPVAMLVNQFNQQDRDKSHGMLDLTLHGQYEVSDQFTAAFALGVKNRAPSYTELYTWFPLPISAGLADGFTYLGNVELDEETANQVDITGHWQQADWSVIARLFFNQVDDYIIGEPANNQPAMMVAMMMGNPAPLQWQNAEAELWGGEIEGQFTLTNRLSLEAVASLVRGKRTDVDDNLFRTSPDNLRTTLRYQSGGWQLNAHWKLYAEQDRVSELQAEQPSAGYGLLDLQGQYQWNDGFELGLHINNLFDKAYQPHLNGVDRVTGEGTKLYSPGRQVAVSFNLMF